MLEAFRWCEGSPRVRANLRGPGRTCGTDQSGDLVDGWGRRAGALEWESCPVVLFEQPCAHLLREGEAPLSIRHVEHRHRQGTSERGLTECGRARVTKDAAQILSPE